MMKRFCLACALVLALALPAQAEVNGVYGGIKFIDSIQSTGNTSVSSDTDNITDQYSQNSVGGGLFAGYDFYPKFQVPLRAELEYAIRSNTQTTWSQNYNFSDGSHSAELKGEWNLQTLFFNAYYDFHNSTDFTPYIGAGAGLGFISNKYTEYRDGNEVDSRNKMNTVFAWNVGVGASYAFNENISADLGYRFVGLGENKVDGLKTNPYANELSLGVRFTF
ncbi:MAG: acyloxyacyl hydrolase [Desulfovibrionaceae bacterium]